MINHVYGRVLQLCIFIQSYIAKNSLRAPENITAQL